jgi:hypothetical protein
MSDPMGPARRDLQAMLVELGRDLDYPRSADVAEGVGARLRSHPRKPSRITSPRRPARAWGFAAIALVAVATGVMTLSPAARTAVAGWLGLPGVRIETRTGPPPSPLGGGLHLGERVTLAEAADRVGFDVVLPRAVRLGAPDAVYLGYPPAGGRVSILYRPGPGLPPAAGSRVGALLTELDATLTDDLVKKISFPDTRLELVAVGPDRGYWITGQAHILLLEPGGGVFEDEARLAGNTLLWLHDGVTLRLESGLTKRRALAVAESVR